jgi:CRP/FNR family transcriptional regulator, cyclic AMP receptor protein
MSSHKSSRLRQTRQPTVKQLARTKLFQDVSTQTLKSLLQDDQVRFSVLEAQTALELQVDEVYHVYVIMGGYLEVRLYSNLIKKGESFLLAFRGPDQIVGEMTAIARHPSVAFISCSEPCQLIQIRSSALERAAEKDWKIYRNIASLLVDKTLQERKRIEVSLMYKGEAQVAQALLNFWQDRGADLRPEGGRTIRGILRHHDVADYIGCDRTTAAKRLGDLKKEKIIWYPGQGHPPHRLSIIDVPRLKTKAASRK